MRCKLCLEKCDSLESSHYIPAGVYKAVRNSGASNPNPYQITPDSVFQSSNQMTARLLGRCCEERFNKRGENWVLRHMLKEDGRFKLEKIIKAAPSISANDPYQTELYFASNIPQISIAELSYFAISVFWRGSIHGWSANGKIPVPLGSYGEEFRKYLMDIGSFPTHAALWVILRQDKKFDRAITSPWGGRTQEGYRCYNFSIPGLAFTLFVGKTIPSAPKKCCFINAIGNPIVATTMVDKTLREYAARLKKEATK